MNLLTRIKRVLLGQNIPHAHAKLLRDGALVYGKLDSGHWTDTGWADGQHKITIDEALGVIDQHIEVADVAVTNAFSSADSRKISIALSMSIALDNLREHFVQETAPAKKGVSDE